jgi:demethylmenaquinone methyltransferase / 2-methoxy-6-polyprenyl-1,4-benzoquinol methylase
LNNPLNLVPDKRAQTTDDHATRVREMFARISGRYDLLNHLLSGNTDKRWRKLVAKGLQSSLNSPDARALDVACGTGDLSLALVAATGARVTGLDFCRPMLEHAARKALDDAAKRCVFIEGDALRLPFRDETFDAVSIAFGLRNLASVERGLGELLRVLKPGGRACVLEFSKPVVPGFNALFQLYFTRMLPRIGGLISGSSSAYEYLPASVSSFPDQKRLAAMMIEAGFDEVEYRNLTGGIAALHLGTRPRRNRV